MSIFVTSGNKARSYRDLAVTLTSAYDWRWTDSGSGGDRDGGFWHPQPQERLRPLGSVAVPHYGNINNQWAVLLVSDNPLNRVQGKGPAVLSPVDYHEVWRDSGSGAKHDGSFWRPVPPLGYVALGDVAWTGYGKPDVDQVWCLRDDLVQGGGFNDSSVWDDRGTGADTDASFWEVIPSVPSTNEEFVPIVAGTFIANVSYARPDASLARVPALYLPRDNLPLPASPPEVASNAIPKVGDTFPDTVQRTVTLPFTFFVHGDDRRCLDKIQDPFCSLSKTASWIVLNSEVNNSQGTLTGSFGMGAGSKAGSTPLNAGVTITAEGELLVGRYSVRLNYQLADSESGSHDEVLEGTQTKPFTISPGTAGLLWGRRIVIQTVRADGSHIGEPVVYTGGNVIVSYVSVQA
ncbi:hypothetical protein MFIFM68171_02559 [Madurella fahalii]|uniref:Insecticidal crystal toxin domain-containing protein n=1 Tax=Madurella fahalii TaxID=1157608 RepID=A0ABQ0G3L6_9PEZI